jgi:hypothetical protein
MEQQAGDEVRVTGDGWSGKSFSAKKKVLKAVCIVCQKRSSVMKWYNIKRHYGTKS